jgi:hypothetical protein
MSRDFILVFGGGMVSLVTSLIVLFVADFIYRREQAKQPKSEVAPPEKMSASPVKDEQAIGSKT